MRISTVQMQNRAVTSMLDRQAELNKTQQQVASGKRILMPSDDVQGSTQILALNKIIDTNVQYSENATVVEARLVQEESSLGQGIDVLIRAKELAIQSGNTALTATERGYIAFEIREILSQVISIANTENSNGEYIFAGFNVDTAPIVTTAAGGGRFNYSYSGDVGQRNAQIGAARFIPVGDPGQGVFMDIPESGGGTESIFKTLETFAVSLEAGAISTTIEADLDSALQNFSGFRAQVGSRLNAIDSNRTLNSDIIFQGQKTLSSIEDLDYASAISRLNIQLSSLEASQQSFLKIQNLSLFNFL
jgi:flagellar hook-associated protein 3 FlgL